MRNYYNLILLALVMVIGFQNGEAQTKENPWVFGVSANAVNLYSGGEDTAPLGPFFDEFINLNDHWNIGFPQVSVSRYLTKNINLTVTGSANEISKWGEFGELDESVLVDNLKYYGLDGMLSYNLGGLFNSETFEPYIGVGGGYTWIEEGQFNTFSSANGTDNLIGAGTVNGSLGFNYWFTDVVGLNLQTTYKHAFEDYLPRHWQHSLGVAVKLGKAPVEEPVVVDSDNDGVPDEFDICPNVAGVDTLGGCPDSDNDGIADKDDLCPNVAGLAAFGGCADTDGDGYADNVDKCPNEYGTVLGCPAKEEKPETPEVVPFTGQRKVYFAFNSAKLDENAKEVLNSLVDNSKSVSYSIDIEGHADSIGSNSYNMELSRKRAEAVKAYLADKGVATSSISISAEGESDPQASNDTDEGRAKNRRAELTIKVSSN